MRIDPHHFNAESDLIESLLNHDSSIISSSSKIDSLFDEFVGELTLLKSISSGIDETDCYPEEETHFTKRLLYDNSSPRPPEEFVSENSDAKIESFSPSHIPIKDSGSLMEEIDLCFTPDDPMPPGIEEDDYDSERDILILEELLDNYSISLPENESFHFDIPSSSRPPAKPPDDSSSKFYMYPRFIQLIIQNQVGDLSTHTTRFISSALTQKVFANMRRVGKGFSGVETPLFEGMLAARQLAEEGIAKDQVQADDAAVQENVAEDVANDAVPLPPSHDIPSPSQEQSSPFQQPQSSPQAPPQGAEFPTHLQQILDACSALTRRVKNLKHDKAAQKLEIIKLYARVKRLESTNKVKSSKLRRLRKVKASKRIESSDDMEDVFNQGRMSDDLDKDEGIELAEKQAEIYHLDLDHPSKVLSMQEDESKVQEVVEVVTTTKLITDVVTTASQVSAASATISAAKLSIPATASIVVAAYTRRRKRVVIRDPEEELSLKTPAETPKLKDKGKGILIETPKPMKKKDQIKLDAEYARKLHEEINKDHEEINKDINWDAAIDHVNQKSKNPQFDANMRFLFKSREEMEEEDQEVIKSINETPAQKAGKRRKLNEEAQKANDLKKHLEVVDDEDDDIFIEATPPARKLLELMLSKRSRKNTKCVNAADEELTGAKHKLMLLSNINAARLKLKLFENITAADMKLSERNLFEPLFDEEIISMRIDPHHFNAESDLIESLLNHDSSIISSSSKIDSLFDEFAGELTLLKSISSGIDETDCYPEEETHFTKRLLYDNSSPRPPEEFVSENSNAKIESFSPSHIPIKDSGSLMKEIDLCFTPDDPMPPGIEEDDYDSERDILILEELLDNYSLSLPENESFHFDIPSSSRPPVKPPDDSSSKFYMYPRFIQLIIQNQVGDLSTHTTRFISPALTQKENVAEDVANDVVPLPPSHDIPSPSQEQSSSPQQPQSSPQAPPQGAEFPTHFQQILDACSALTRRVENLEHDKAAQKLEIIKLKARVKRLERTNKVKSSKLRRLRKVRASKRIESSDDMEDVFNQGMMSDDLDKDEGIELAEIYHLDLDHPSKVLSMQEDESEVQEVVEVVTTAKLITDVVTTAFQVSAASATISAAKPSFLLLLQQLLLPIQEGEKE
nr:hypothetical protein [Tanacetum cinerariifolium]